PPRAGPNGLTLERHAAERAQPVALYAHDHRLALARRYPGQRLDVFQVRHHDEIVGAGIAAHLLDDPRHLAGVVGLVCARRVERRERLRGRFESDAGRVEATAVAAGKHALDRRRTRAEQGADLAGLLLAA